MALNSHRDDFLTSSTRPRRSTSLRSDIPPHGVGGSHLRIAGSLRYERPQDPSNGTENSESEHLSHGQARSRDEAAGAWLLRSSPRERDSNEVELDELAFEDHTDDEEAGLTKIEGRKRRRRRMTNAMMDGVALDVGGISLQEKKLADANVLWALLVNASFIGLWYTFSLSISLVRHPGGAEYQETS